jgi:hypothetical protein
MLALLLDPLFYAGPILLPPLLDTFRVLFASLSLRLLTGPTRASQQTPGIGVMEIQPELALDHLRDASAGPKIIGIARLESSGPQNLQQTILLLAPQTTGAAGMRLGR